MTWIKMMLPTPENPEVQAVRRDSIVLSHSLIPGAMKHAFATYGALLDPKLPLTRRQHEMIAATVSAVNRCFY